MVETNGHCDCLRHDLLTDVATPQLYRTNAFRVLGLPVNIDGAEVSRQLKKLKLLDKLGDAASHNDSNVLPLTPPPDTDTLRKAGQRLHDMQSRLVDELFWFWPTTAGSINGGDGHALLKAGDVAGAHRAWSSVPSDHLDWPVAVHNLAVMHHALVLDIECGTSDQPNGQADVAGRVDQHWKAALGFWAHTVESEAAWTHLESRAEALDDPRLTSGLVRRLRQSLPTVILSISVNLAVRAAKRGDVEHARRHLMYIRQSGLDLHLADSLLEREASPLVEQVRRFCESIAEQSKANPETGDQLAQSVLKDCQARLTSIRAILDKDHHLRQTAFDLVASTVRGCVIDYGNETEDWGGCIPTLEQAAALALNEGLQSRLQDDLARVKKNHTEEQRVEELKKAVTADRVYEVAISSGAEGIELPGESGVLLDARRKKLGLRASVPGICTCCLGPPDGEQAVGYEWEETQGVTRYKRSLSFNFPICDICRRHQAEYSRKRAVLVLLAAGLSTGLVYLALGEIQRPEWLPLVIGGGICTILLAFLLSAMIRLRLLPEQHSCRDEAVEMPEASDSQVVFRFHNPLYAEAFADSNGTTAVARRMRKPTRGSYILAGRGAVLSIIVALVLGGVAQSIIYAVNEDDRQHSSRSPTRSSVRPPSRSYTPRRPSVPSRRSSGLSARIDSGKARATELEIEVRRMDSELESLSANIRRYKGEIEGYERQHTRSGVRVNQYAYEQTLDQHNRLVNEYNSLLSTRNLKHSEYEREVDAVNDLVRRYNRGER